MSGVRDRIEREERQALENRLDGVRISTGTQQAGAVTSLRDRAILAAYEASDDPVVKPDSHHSGTTTVVQYPGSVRQRLAKQQYESELIANPTQQTVIMADEEERVRLSRIRNAELAVEGDRHLRERKAQQQRDVAAVKQQQEEKQKMFAVNLALASATADEVTQVKSIVARNFPADRYSPERHWMVLQNLRDAVGIPESNPKPTWTEIF
jgi:hypothetical protein